CGTDREVTAEALLGAWWSRCCSVLGGRRVAWAWWPRRCSGLVTEASLGLGGRGVARCLVAEVLLGLLRNDACGCGAGRSTWMVDGQGTC
ncbi:unnamed protein product, partial [Musa textilis]